MMNTSRPTIVALVFLISTITSFKSSYCLQNTTIFCPEIEGHSLLNLKQSLEDPHNILSSWHGEVNCCKWEGVTCSNSTGHVHQIHLHGLSGKINPSLLNLKHLRYLDLSLNNFPQTIPSFIASFANLEYLNLSHAGFYGMIPDNIGNLSYLHTLDLANINVDVDNLDWLLGLSRLEYLNMIGVDLRRATNWAQVINSLPSLIELHFASCSLDYMTPLNDVNITSLAFIDLSHNKFESVTIPEWIFQLTNLLSLDLSFNSFIGPIPAISNTTKLQYIDLSRNQLNSSIPDWLYFCKDLEVVHFSDNLLHGGVSNAIANLTSLNTFDLFGNHLSGKIPREVSTLCKLQFLLFTYNEFQGELSDSFGNMSECFLRSIRLLCLRNNRLSGHVIDQFGEFKRIERLHFAGNSFSGAIPTSLGKLSSLIELSMYGNKFTGNIPESFSQLVNLQDLYIDDNMLDGIVTETHFSNLTKLETFSASGNLLRLKVSPNWIPPFRLTTLRIGSWKLGLASQVPRWLETQKSIQELDLSNSGLSGRVPIWLWKIDFLNLSHNHLHGMIPYIRHPQFVYLSSNQFSGSLPRVANTVRELDLSNNSFSGGISHFLCDKTYGTYGLQILHLGGNQLSGILPDCWIKWPNLKYLNIGNNFMSGRIPNSIGSLAFLMSLNLYGNNFSGQIPSSLCNCTELRKIELADNDLDGNLPTWLGTSLVKLKFLILRTNMLSGKISPKICHLTSLQILDLSDNKFSGTIPRCVYNFTPMATKRDLATYDYSFSSYWRVVFIDSAIVATKGSELQYDTILSLVTNIDLSKNNLSGNIPEELTRLVELRSLNLSGNNLTGLIPDNIGDMQQLESLDFSKNSLSSQIPISFERLSSLSRLNLSSNNLTGRIPEATQLQSFDASSFTGNDLCGPPLTNKCSNYGGEVHEHNEKNEGDESEIEWLYVFVSLGYAVGFSVVCTTLVLNKSWREAYFEFIGDMWAKLCVYCRFTQ